MANLTGSTTAVFFVRLSAAVDEIVDVDWSTRDGTAIAGKDYEAASGTVSFFPGETEKAIDVIVYGQDDVTADGKKFYIELKPPANAVLTNALAECVITVADEDGVLVTSLVIAQGKRGLKGNPGLSAYEQAVLMGYEGTVEQWMEKEANAARAAERAEAAAVAANIASKVFASPESGVNPNTGVPVGDYFNVRSPLSTHYVDEYQNIGGAAIPTGKSYPSATGLENAIAATEANAIAAEMAATAANIAGKVYSTPEAGVDPVTGVDIGEHFNVRSTDDDNFIDEYRNVGGVATSTGKSYPSTSAVQYEVSGSETLTPVVLSNWSNEIAKLQRKTGTASPEFNAQAQGLLNLIAYIRSHKNLIDRDSAGSHIDSAISTLAGRNQQEKNKDIQSVKDFGAIGDGTLHTVNEWTVVGSKIYYPNLAAIQVDYPHVTALTDSIDWAAAQKAINTTKIAYYPKSTGAYINNKTLQLNGNWDAVIGASKQVVVMNIGAGLAALRLTKSYQTVRNIAIWGDGGAYGVGATTGHGIHLDNGTSTNFHDVSIRYHGGHGIYGNNGVWITKVTQCYIEHNLLDGINIVSPSGATFDQNGNALSITDSTIAANGGNGVKWKAVALSISGSVLEANKGYGLLVTTVGYIASAFGISFVGNYTENNVLGELKFESTTTAIVTDVNIAGNYFYSIQTGGAIAAITFVGPYRSTRSVNIRSNSLAQGGTVLNLVDGGNSLREDCTIDAGSYSVVNMTQCQLIQGNKTKSISGAFLSKGVTWTNPSGPSANFFSATATDIYFPIDLQQAQALLDIKFYMTANMTASYNMAARIMSKDSSTGGSPVTEYSITLSSGSSGGNTLFTFTPVSSNQPIRIAANKSYYLHLTVSPPSTGSSIQIHDPILRFV